MVWDKVLIVILNATLEKLWLYDCKKMLLLMSQDAKDVAMKFAVENIR